MEAPKNMVAARTVIAYMDGKRTQFAPGEKVPAGVLTPHDVVQLKSMGAVRDLDEEAAANDAAEAHQVQAAKKFEAARQGVIAERESIKPSAPPSAPETAATASEPTDAAPTEVSAESAPTDAMQDKSKSSKSK